jgi:hypothetical protein
VRSNFKKTLYNEEPRIFKFEPILGRGSCLVTLTFTKFESSSVYFRPDCAYSLKVFVRHTPIAPTNCNFTLSTLACSKMSFYVPNVFRKKKVTCKVVEVKVNEVYDKGKMEVNLADDGEQEVEMISKQGKVVAVVTVHILKECNKKK